MTNSQPIHGYGEAIFSCRRWDEPLYGSCNRAVENDIRKEQHCRKMQASQEVLRHFTYMPAAGIVHLASRIMVAYPETRDPRPESKLISAQGIFHSMQKDTIT